MTERETDYEELAVRALAAAANPEVADIERENLGLLREQAVIYDEQGMYDLANRIRREAKRTRLVIDAVEGRTSRRTG